MIFGACCLNRGENPAPVLAALRRAGDSRPAEGLCSGGRAGFWHGAGEQGIYGDEDFRVVYDGELYNYPELRAELEAAGARFKSRLDSELVLRAYEKWGAGCQERFNGQWAFAIWDGRRSELFCSRDRFGLRPFYYSLGGNIFLFASSARNLVSCGGIKKEPDDDAVFSYLTLNDSELPGQTFFKGVKPLDAGCSLLLPLGGKLAHGRYYSPEYNPELGEFDGKKLKKYSSEFLELFKSAVRGQMSVPGRLGCMLSGGLDSSSIAFLADGFPDGKAPGRPSGSGEARIFSINWKEEAPYLKAMGGAVGLKRTIIGPCAAERMPWEELARRAMESEIPLASQSEIGYMQILKAALRRNVQVLFDGNGGDELLAGYPERYFYSYLNQILCGGDLPRFEREFKTLFARRLGEFRVAGKLPAGFYKTFLRTQSAAPQLSEFWRGETLNRSFLRACSRRAKPAPRLSLNLQRQLWGDTLNLGNWYNPTVPIRHRYPFLDHRLVKYVFSLPACYKIHGGWTKYLLRTAMDRLLPESVCWRRDKVGGTAPMYAWKAFLARNRDELRGVLSARQFRSSGYLDQKSVLRKFDALFAAAVSPGATDISGLWRFVNLELWLRGNMR